MISLADKLIGCGASFKSQSGYFLSFSSASLATYSYDMAVSASQTVYLIQVVDTPTFSVIVAVDSAGELLWQQKITFSAVVSPVAISSDQSGNFYVLVTTNSGEYNFAGLLKYSSAGVLQWQRALSRTSYSVFLTSMALDADDNVYITGYYAAASPSNLGVFAKFNPSGVLQWQKSLSNSNGITFKFVAFGGSGDFYVGGVTASNGYAILAKYSNAGARSTTLQQYNIGLSLTYGGSSIAADASGNVYVAGHGYSNSAATNVFHVSKYNSNLTHQWTKTADIAPQNLNGSGKAITVDGSNIIAQVHDAVTPFGEYVLALAQSDGSAQWERKLKVYAHSNTTYVNAISTNPGVLDVTGYGKVDGTTTNAFAGHLNSSDTLGSYGTAFELTEPPSFNYNSGTFTNNSLTLTDATADLIDAAGSFTDASGTLTVTKHTKV